MSEIPNREKPPSFLEINAEKHPDKTAIIGLEKSLTYGQLRQRARALASSLYGLGVRPGDQAALMTYNLPEQLEVAMALPYLEVGLVMVGYRMKPPEIEYIVGNSDSKVLIFWHEFADRILPYKHKFPKVLPWGFISFGGPCPAGALSYEDLFKNPPDLDLDNLSPAKQAGTTMVYTSGTTGRPKGAARKTDFVSKPGVLEFFFATIRFLNLDSNDVHLTCCPVYHSAPSYFSSVNFLLGGTRVYQPHFDPVQFLELVARHRVTSTHLVPTMVVRLLQVPDIVTRNLDLSSLTRVICGAAPLFPEYKLAFLERFGDCLYEYYGATETGLNTFITPQEMRRRPNSVGKAFANNELKIYDDQGHEVRDGERGVLYIHSPIMMEGYYKNEKATFETHRGKYMTAGDVAVRDNEGYIYIVDRVKDMIIRGGVNIYPAEVEEVLVCIPGVADAAVVGKPDPELGETVSAFVVLEKGSEVNEEIIKEYCGQLMANQKIPATIVFLDKIPRNPTGKILKKDLREALNTSLILND